MWAWIRTQKRLKIPALAASLLANYRCLWPLRSVRYFGVRGPLRKTLDDMTMTYHLCPWLDCDLLCGAIHHHHHEQKRLDKIITNPSSVLWGTEGSWLNSRLCWTTSLTPCRTLWRAVEATASFTVTVWRRDSADLSFLLLSGNYPTTRVGSAVVGNPTTVSFIFIHLWTTAIQQWTPVDTVQGRRKRMGGKLVLIQVHIYSMWARESSGQGLRWWSAVVGLQSVCHLSKVGLELGKETRQVLRQSVQQLNIIGEGQSQ